MLAFCRFSFSFSSLLLLELCSLSQYFKIKSFKFVRSSSLFAYAYTCVHSMRASQRHSECNLSYHIAYLIIIINVIITTSHIQHFTFSTVLFLVPNITIFFSALRLFRLTSLCSTIIIIRALIYIYLPRHLFYLFGWRLRLTLLAP